MALTTNKKNIYLFSNISTCIVLAVILWYNIHGKLKAYL